MGQKTHPLGFRLGITQEHKSNGMLILINMPIFYKKMIKFELILNTIAKQIVFQMFKLIEMD
jgi:hypothetical protein